MDTAELIARYKSWPIRNRLILVGVLGFAYPSYLWFTDLPPLEEQLTAAQNEQNEAKTKLEKVKKEQENLPKVEQEFKFVQDQLAKAKAMLPEKIAMEDILSKTASIARETHVSMREFLPAAEQEVRGDYRYAEVAVALSIRGGFGNIMSFYDRLVHLAANVRLRGLDFMPIGSTSDKSAASSGARDVDAKVTMVFFRSTDAGEVVAKEPPAAPKQKNPKAEGAGASGGE